MRRICNLIAALMLVLGLCACGPNTAEQWQEQYDLGVRYLSEGNYQEAIIAFTAAIEIDPKRPEAYVGRGGAYVASGETAENLSAAMSDYQAALELDEALPEAWLGLADTYIRWGDFDQALETLRGALEKTGNDQSIADKLAEMEGGSFTDSDGNERRVPVYGADGEIQEYIHVKVFHAADEDELRDALNDAGNGAIITLDSGDYSVGCLSLWELSHVTIQGTGETRLLSPYGDDTILEIVGCDDITLRGLIMGDELEGENMSCTTGVLWADSSSVSLYGCEIFGCGLEGLWAYESDIYAEDTTIRDCSMCILECVGGRGEFRSCTFTGNGYGEPFEHAIWVSWETQLLFDGCVFRGNFNPSLYNDDQSNQGSTVTLEGCTFEGNAWDAPQPAEEEEPLDSAGDWMPADFLSMTVGELSSRFGGDFTYLDYWYNGTAKGLYYEDLRLPLVFYFLDAEYRGYALGGERIAIVECSPKEQPDSPWLAPGIPMQVTYGELLEQGLEGDFYTEGDDWLQEMGETSMLFLDISPELSIQFYWFDYADPYTEPADIVQLYGGL